MQIDINTLSQFVQNRIPFEAFTRELNGDCNNNVSLKLQKPVTLTLNYLVLEELINCSFQLLQKKINALLGTNS
jgi:hypothetical protein